mmetsp:Transcript_17214/g.34655  ORF Transcript_17214/g.34655 Transcript_17214/m.34655 type:complete len:210 (-) Transcript_17214:74-703(-)
MMEMILLQDGGRLVTRKVGRAFSQVALVHNGSTRFINIDTVLISSHDIGLGNDPDWERELRDTVEARCRWGFGHYHECPNLVCQHEIHYFANRISRCNRDNLFSGNHETRDLHVVVVVLTIFFGRFCNTLYYYYLVSRMMLGERLSIGSFSLWVRGKVEESSVLFAAATRVQQNKYVYSIERARPTGVLPNCEHSRGNRPPPCTGCSRL